MTMKTSTIASISVCSTCSIERLTKSEVSYGADQLMPSGKYCCSSAMRALTAFATATALPLLDSCTAIPVVDSPFRRADVM